MASRVCASDDDTFFVPVSTGVNIGGAVAERQATATAVGSVGGGAMQQQICMDREFTRLKLVIDDGAVLFGVIDALIEHVVVRFAAGAISQVPNVLRACNEFHAGVFYVGIVDR